jgi:hypothetical protein
MEDRIQRALDGELPPERLTETEAAELAVYAEVIRSTLELLPRGVPGDLAPKVMERIEELGSQPRPAGGLAGLLRRVAGWLWTPRPVTVVFRPAFGLAAAVLGVLLVGLSAVALREPEAGDAPLVFVQFRLDAPQAREVALAGDFTGWRPTYALRETAPGVWSVVVPLEPGVYDYVFIVDGTSWLPDPLAPQVEDGFGGANSRVAVLAPERRRRSS